MSIKLTLLKSGETLISEMKELVAEESEQAHAYLLENPHVVETREKSFLTESEKKTGDFGIDVTLIPWIVLSADKKVTDEKIKALENFWIKIGCKTKIMPFEDHDYILSLTSHLPHAVAYSIVKTAINNENKFKILTKSVKCWFLEL